MIKRLRFSVSEVSPLLARLASVVPTEFVIVELLLSLERSERTEEEDDEELEDPDELGELYVFG